MSFCFRLPFLVLSILLAGLVPAAPLDSRIEQMISEGAARHAVWGVYAMEAESGKVLADVNGTRLLVPASNRKLVSTALASWRFEADQTFATELRAEAMSGGVVSGDIVLHATGDPSWMPALLRGRPGTTKLREIAQQAAKNGLTQVNGSLVIDAGRYERPHLIPPAWNWDEFASSYASLPAALSANSNLGSVSIRPGSVGEPLVVESGLALAPFEIVNESRTLAGGSAPTLFLDRSLDGRTLRLTGGLPRDSSPAMRGLPLGSPAEYWAGILLAELREAGVQVAGGVRMAGRTEKGAVLLATVEGARVADIMTECNLESDNFLAESLYMLVAAERFGSANYRGAYRLEEEYWTKIGVSMREVLPSDGSGLSRENAITAHAFCELLRERRNTAFFVESLPVAGRSGTLRYRLAGANVRAKTGTLDGVSALGGYIKASSTKTIVFSVMANNYTGSAPPIRTKIDEIVSLLAQQ